MLVILRKKKPRINRNSGILTDAQMNPYYKICLDRKHAHNEEDDLKKSRFGDIQEESIYEALDDIPPPITILGNTHQVPGSYQSTEGPPLPSRVVHRALPPQTGASVHISSRGFSNPMFESEHSDMSPEEDDYISMKPQNQQDT